MPGFDVAVIGGGIVGCATAAFLAEAGASVLLAEREAIAAGASGRNSGIVQHPMDATLLPLFEATVAHYRELAAHGFSLPAEPGGLIVLAEEEAALAHELDVLAAFPELRAEALAPGEPARIEPCVAPGLAGIRLEAGYAVPPAAATAAFAARADAAGARARDRRGRGARARRHRVGGRTVAADAVVVAAGPWTPAVVDPSGAWRPIAPLWGVNVEVHLAEPPRHAVEQAGIDALIEAGGDPPPLFSMVTADGVSSLGSTFLAAEPDAAALAPRLRANGARFVPALATTPIASVRACARPLSADGRPLLGRAPGRDDVFVAAGHGAWGISLGPGSARLVADLVLGRADAAARRLRPRAVRGVRLPDGEPAPADGALPARALAGRARPFGVYVHVPFCASRCGYCDFNTYVPGRAARDGYVDAVLAEWALAERVLGGAPPAATRCSSAAARRRCSRPASSRGCSPRSRARPAPRSPSRRTRTPSTAPACARCGAAGATRLSLGMQSAVPHVLATLDRMHTPGARRRRRAAGARRRLRARLARPHLRDARRDATPTGRRRWTRSLAAGVDHVSAYPLIVEPGTRLHAQVRRGALPAPDEDAQARRYRMADAALAAAGLALVRDLQLGGGRRRRAARTTSATGARTTGGASARARTRTSAACAGGTSSIPARYAARAGAGPLARRRARAARRRAAAHGAHDAAASGSPRASPLGRRAPPPRLAADGLLDPAGARARRRAAHARRAAARRPRRARAAASRARRGGSAS